MRSVVVLGITAVFGLLCAGCIFPKPGRGEIQVAPDIRGRVCDSQTGRPVEGASVMIDDRPEMKDLTDADGRFHIKAAHTKYVVEFMSPGGVEGYFPPAGHIYGELSVQHPACQDLRVWIREHLDSTPSNTNFDGPLVMSDLLLIPKK
jgi:hypothetical protein